MNFKILIPLFLISHLISISFHSLIFNRPMITQIIIVSCIRKMLRDIISKNKYHIPFISFKILLTNIISKLKFIFTFLYEFFFTFLIVIYWINTYNLRIRRIIIYSRIKIICPTYFVDGIIMFSVIISLYLI
jgi:hypothetical protein